MEITVEVNPATVTHEDLKKLFNAGVNRLSIGMQSANNNELRDLGRIHTYSDFVKTYSDARSAGFDNVSADLMYGIPEQTMESFERSIRVLASLDPEHISSYCLKVEENTPFGRMGDSLVLPDEDTQCDMYELLSSLLPRLGYEKYEISNFSKKGRESRHNVRYWTGLDYLGFGAAAHSYFGGERFSTSQNILSFAKSEFIESEREKIDCEERMREFVMLRLRLLRGFALCDFEGEFGVSFLEKFKDVSRFERSGHIVIKDGRCHFTEKGFFVSSYILSELLDY
jgi:oxygen-independent coproporphyrinogen-3 oxidase